MRDGYWRPAAAQLGVGGRLGVTCTAVPGLDLLASLAPLLSLALLRCLLILYTTVLEATEISKALFNLLPFLDLKDY
jgi:hypothetical protein